MEENKEYYIYAHVRLDNFTPFYIGKGKGDRAYDLGRNKHHDSIAEKCGYAVVIVKDGLTEKEAFELERDIIEDLVFNEGYGIDVKGCNKYNHKKDNYLTNQTWGGEGASGYNPSEEVRKKYSERSKRFWSNKENREKQSQKMKGRFTGDKNPMYGKQGYWKGKTIPEEYRKRMSESHAKINGDKNPNSKMIYCIELEKSWSCAKYCAKELNISYKALTIGANKKHLVEGLTFKFINKKEEDKYKKYLNNNIDKNIVMFYKKKRELMSHGAKGIYCLELRAIRGSAKEWAEELSICRTDILRNCSKENKCNHVKQYHFRYATEEEIKEWIIESIKNEENN